MTDNEKWLLRFRLGIMAHMEQRIAKDSARLSELPPATVVRQIAIKNLRQLRSALAGIESRANQ